MSDRLPRFVKAVLVPAVVALGVALPCQEREQENPQDPQKQELAKQRARAERLLRQHAAASKKVSVLVADYVQRRSTPLSKQPLVSKGAFLFVKQPACVVFRAREPRPAIVRLTATRYEVFRPRRRRLERFELQGPELSQGLFAAIGGDADRLLRDFAIVGCLPLGKLGERVQVRLEPRKPAVKKRLQELLVTFVQKGGALHSVAYRDHSGDLVEIELHKPRTNPKDAPSVEFDVPEGTRILEHKPKASDGK